MGKHRGIYGQMQTEVDGGKKERELVGARETRVLMEEGGRVR